MFRCLAVIALLVAFVPTASAADAAPSSKSALDHIVETGRLRVCQEVGYVPFEMNGKNGETIGFDVDMAKAMAAAMGVALELKNFALMGRSSCKS